jgi:putative transcriptional regulator
MSDTLRGQFLIAGCKLRDTNFFKTAVLVIEHGKDGAMGLVVNRPSSVTVSNALAGHFDLPETGELVYIGGPVEPAALFILHSAPEHDPEDPSVLPGLYVASSAEVFSHVVQANCNGGGDAHYRVFSGCAGWGPNQLESELARGDWFIHPARPELVFHDDPYAVWDTLLREVYRSKRLLPVECDNPEWN